MGGRSTDPRGPSAGYVEGYAQGKRDGSRFHAAYGPVGGTATPRDALRAGLEDALVGAAVGRPPSIEQVADLRRLAASQRHRDWDRFALSAMAVLADRFVDDAARAWLAPMLAHAGRFADAADVEHGWTAEGRPSAPDFAVLVSALSLLGRTDEAADRWTALRARFTGLADQFVSVWDTTPLGAAYRRLAEDRPTEGELPVFFHLPFSGGTSMIVSLKQTVPRSRLGEINRRFGMHQIERLRALDPAAVDRMLLLHQHHPFAAPVRGRTPAYFTVLRDPVSQISSGFHKRVSTSGIVPARDHADTFEEFARRSTASGMTNLLARQLVTTHPALRARFDEHFGGGGWLGTIGAEEDMYWVSATADLRPDELLRLARETLDERFSVVGTMGHLAASHLAGAATIDVPVVRRLVHKGASGRPAAGDSRETAVEERLREANWVDQTLYDEYTARFEMDHADLVEAVEAPAGSREEAAALPAP